MSFQMLITAERVGQAAETQGKVRAAAADNASIRIQMYSTVEAASADAARDSGAAAEGASG